MNKEIDKLRMKIAIFNAEEEIKQKSNKCIQKNTEKRRMNFMRKKIIATACASFVLVSGIVVAANIEKIKTNFRGLGDGVDTAVENGYIAESNVEDMDSNVIGTNQESKIEVNNMEASITIENFLMDDVNLSSQILFKFDDKLKDIVDLDAVCALELTDLIIRDEENRIIYGGNDEERFKKYCEENKLNYTFTDFNKNYMNCGVNCFNVSHDKENNSVTIMYNMYTDNFPKSKKLYFSFGKIEMLEVKENQEVQNEIVINGNWEILVDVPEKMYNRTDEYYKVVSCDNDDFEVYSAKVADTGFELGVIISNIEEPETDMEKLKKWGTVNQDYESGKISYDEAMELANWYKEWADLYHPISITNSNFKDEEINASYVKNENNKTFNCSLSASRNCKTIFLENNKYNFYETFEMTKYDSTDTIKVVLYYYGKPVTIELQKIYR